MKNQWFLYMLEGMEDQTISEAKKRLLDRMKRGDPATAADLAAALGLTDVAVRQHLLALEGQGLVGQRPQPPSGRGRPAVLWTLTPLARDRPGPQRLRAGGTEPLRPGG